MAVLDHTTCVSLPPPGGSGSSACAGGKLAASRAASRPPKGNPIHIASAVWAIVRSHRGPRRKPRVALQGLLAQPAAYLPSGAMKAVIEIVIRRLEHAAFGVELPPTVAT